MNDRNLSERDVSIAAAGVQLEGSLTLPTRPRGIVLFAHGSGSSRLSPRNRFVAGVLNRDGLATLLVDLLTSPEEAIDETTRELRFDIDLLARRLLGIMDWLRSQPETRDLKLGLFGASTGAGAALKAAGERPESVAAVVSRGGRPDLAGESLSKATAPTLLIVGGADPFVIELNESALAVLPGEKRLEVVPGATHLFEEPGALERVAVLASRWFVHYLSDLDPLIAGAIQGDAPADSA